ncbi:hypothetical protein KP77_14720 [Jeotgalibacillus alimentarius]|uniref:Uncharacterized protein n=1 Tax=Jeotgalibacillus alimentarius TaxID=135826 RepID=A0A0C2VMH8_9BACL|nr:hypothetical protein [Jeotgalibacillus alimentarius]KIL50097.1 hypothetical protein KP77_14720 [Jeotgalibacillus alimentarius]
MMKKTRVVIMIMLIPVLIVIPAASAALLYILPLFILLSILSVSKPGKAELMRSALLILALYLIGVTAEELVIRLIAIIFIIFTLLFTNS